MARSISLLGDWVSLIAVIAMLREVVGSNPKVLSGLLILKLLPIFLAGPLAGVVADRFSRKTIMVVSDLNRVVLVLGLLATPFVPWPLEFAYVLILLQVVSSAFFEPARSAALPQLVPPRHLASANAIGAVNWSLMFTLGAALGGVVTDLLGWRAALAIDAGTYLVSALLVSRMSLPRRERRPDSRVEWQTLTGFRDFRDGVRFILGRRDVATVIFIKTGWGLAGAITLFLTLFGERVYTLGGRPDLGVGVLYVARALGTGIGPLLARRFLPDESPRAMRALIAVSFVWPLVWYLSFSWVRHPAPAVLCVVIAHFGGATLWVYSTVMLQRMVPDEFLGRVMSTDLGLATLAISASTWFYGVLAAPPDADLRALVRWMALSLLVPLAVWLVAAARWPVGVSQRDGDD
jgi:predicted MFS family arabinose efflux permease